MFTLIEIDEALIVDQVNCNQPGLVKAFLRLAESHMLVYIAKDKAPAIKDALRRLPLDMQALWAEILNRSGVNGLITRNCCSCNRGALSGVSSSLRLVDSSATASNCSACGQESVPWTQYSVSRKYSQVESLRSKSWRRGSSRSDVYATSLQDWLAFAKKITIIDRYALVRQQPGSRPNGLMWFLSELYGRNNSVGVLVLTAFETSSVQRAQEQALASHIPRTARKTGQVGLWQISGSSFGGATHDRFLEARVGGRPISVSIGQGFTVFANTTLRREATIHLIRHELSGVVNDLGYRPGAEKSF